MATRPKHVSFAKQREKCRLNKYTYTEKCESCKDPILMCNYPFEQPEHKKGFCKASTCTDMRTLPVAEEETPISTDTAVKDVVPQSILDAEKQEEEEASREAGEGQTEALNTGDGQEKTNE